ncbi:MAG: alpha/beta hydrolase [Ginsengibacter sp.]
MKHIYCVSGLGADEGVFSKYDFNGNIVHYIKWEIPLPRETIQHYAKRLSLQIKYANPVLVGLSFGGILCIEISKIIPSDLIIVISSVKSFHEIPYWMRLAGKLKLNKIFPVQPFKLIEPLENYNLGVENEAEKKMAAAYRANVDRGYCRWSVNQILNWNNEWRPENLFHIHGSNDRIFPLKKIKADHVIEGGGHFMIMNRAELVSAHVNQILRVNQV